MKFTQKPLADAADLSAGKTTAYRVYARMLVILGIGFLMVNLAVWATVEVAVLVIPVEWEVRMFRFLDVGKSDRVELALFQEVLHTLEAHPDTPPYPYRLTLLSVEEPNAFAIPGGTIGITEGLVKALEDDEVAIAFLLGHELGHFYNRDHLRGIGRALLLTGCRQLLLPGAGDMTGDLALNAIMTAYSRKQEEAADLFGLQLVYDCYGHGDGATRLLELLHESMKVPEWAYMLTTHPGPQARIERIEQALEAMTPTAVTP